jgi:putative ABC transport system ATP-binding protein
MDLDLRIRDLTVEYVTGGYTLRPLDGLDLDARDGELVLLLGPSGCGKTTLLSCLGGILTPTSGSIRVGGTEVTDLDAASATRYRRDQVGIVFQAFNLIPSLTAQENVAAPLLVSGVRRATALRRAGTLLEQVGMGERLRHRPGRLSGGQQQRVAIARGLAHDPPLLLGDEPTANLDYIQAESVIRLLRDLARPGRLVVVATHDDRLVPIADRVVELATDSHGEVGPPQELLLAGGETVFRQGSRGQLIYVIEAGEVEILRELADGGEERLAVLGPGEYFGELGPLLGFPRSATARTSGEVRLTAYGASDFKQRVLPQRGDRDGAALPAASGPEA